MSHLDAPDTPDKMADTLILWNQIKDGMYDVYTSEIALYELQRNREPKKGIIFQQLAEIDYTLITSNDEIRAYAEKLNSEGILSTMHMADCLQIGCAVVYNCDAMLSWNLNHIVRVKTINGVRIINAMLGYKSIDIYSPDIFI
jgi:predicted nucleic acid-binding protein